MARPKANTNKKQALERIEDAFWQLLAEKPFGKITISQLSKTAGVNHNLIYYYFDNIEDMAKQLFEKNIGDGILQRIITVFMGKGASHKELIASPEMIKRVNRARLFMRSDSAYLNLVIKERLQIAWLEAVGADKEQLTLENLIDLEFVLNGIVSVVGSHYFDESPEAIATLHGRPLGKAIADTLKEFGK